MQFTDHLKAFLDGAAEGPELETLAAAALGAGVRRLKLAIAEHVLEARLLAGRDERAASQALTRARALRAQLDAALGEYRSLVSGRGSIGPSPAERDEPVSLAAEAAG